jgi:hypothetical protein
MVLQCEKCHRDFYYDQNKPFMVHSGYRTSYSEEKKIIKCPHCGAEQENSAFSFNL